MKDISTTIADLLIKKFPSLKEKKEKKKNLSITSFVSALFLLTFVLCFGRWTFSRCIFWSSRTGLVSPCITWNTSSRASTSSTTPTRALWTKIYGTLPRLVPMMSRSLIYVNRYIYRYSLLKIKLESIAY